MEQKDTKESNDVVVDSKSINDGGEQCTDIAMDYSSEFTTHEVFKSREDMVKWTREVGTKNGFAIIIKTSDAGTLTKKPRVTFGCEREGKHVSLKKIDDDPQKKRRKTGTKKCGCPFALKGKKLENDDDWSLVVICGVHNHSLFVYREGHTFAGRLNSEESNLVADLYACSAQPKVIFNALKKKFKTNVSTMRTVYNARQRLKVAEKAGRTNMQLFMSRVLENNYVEFHRKCDETNHLKDLFFAHPFGVDLLRTFPHVLIMDCTYKTNRFNIPLLQIVGMTSTENNFTAAFAFIENEKEENYKWALERLCALMVDDSVFPQVIVTDRDLALMNAIGKVFPRANHMLCTWHIGMNVATNCKKIMRTKKTWDKFYSAWNMVVHSSTREDYHQNVTTLSNDFSKFPDAIKYVTNNWLIPYKERFVSAWTDNYMHFGNATSNRAESQHSKLKRQLRTNQHNYETLWTAIDDSLLSEHTLIRESFEMSRMVLPLQYKSTHLFDDIKGFVSTSALDYIFNETKNLDSIGKDVVSCGCELRRTQL